MTFIGRRAAVADPGADRRDTGGDLQALAGPAIGREFQAGILLFALLGEGEGAVVIGPGVLVRLADLEQRRGQADALPVVLDPGLDLP
ncbi:hypothetical protein D3C86_1605040 [compost metagenome]